MVALAKVTLALGLNEARDGVSVQPLGAGYQPLQRAQTIQHQRPTEMHETPLVALPKKE
jgi:hypothetical protein